MKSNCDRVDSWLQTLPARAIVIRQRVPNAYDDKALRLEVGLGRFTE